MALFEYSVVAAEVQVDLDMQDDEAVTPNELKQYFNAAIRDAAAIIQLLYEGYFLAYDFVALVAGTESYDMPDNIYAVKMVKVFYATGARKYEVERLSLEDILNSQPGDDFGWNPESSTPGDGAQFVLYPTPTVTESDTMKRWYIREPMAIVDDDDVIDIPEFISFIKAHVKVNAAIKLAHPNLQFWMGEREKEEQRMRNTLKTMVLDGANAITADMTFYDDFSPIDGSN